MKTIAYIDGYNLYYSRLKLTNYKWLDLFTLFNDHILRPQDPSTDLHRVKFYTAAIKGKFASNGNLARQAQQAYHRALLSPMTGPVDVIEAYHTAEKSTPMRYKEPPEKSDKVEAWKIEEKQTDVNLALDMYRDAARGNCEQIVLCTADSDIVPALKYVKADFPNIKIGLVVPRKEHHDNQRPVNKSLADEADWVRTVITDAELTASQFKERVPTNKKPIYKPSYW